MMLRSHKKEKYANLNIILELVLLLGQKIFYVATLYEISMGEKGAYSLFIVCLGCPL